jgi:hypothetical protein
MKMQLFIIILLMALFSYTNAYDQTEKIKTDSTEIDTVKGKIPEFNNVDVVTETEWGASERIENATVFIFLEAKHPHLLIKENKHKRCELRIVKGLTIKIYDHKSGKLLKTYPEEN